MTTRRITSGEEWKYRNGSAGLRGLGISRPYPATRYDKLAANFLAGVALVTALAFWL